MSEFSDAFAASFDSSLEVFGDECELAGETFDCVIHGLELRQTIRPGEPGRKKDVEGSVHLSAATWAEAKELLTAQGKKVEGARIGLPGGVFRITNDPDVGYSSATVQLQIGPLT